MVAAMNHHQQIPASTAALRRLFQWLEKRYGGIPMEQGLGAEVIRSESTSISTIDLQRLMRHDALAIHVPNFYAQSAARRLGQQLAQEASVGSSMARNWKVSTRRGLESSDVTTLGAHVPYNVANASGAIDEYFTGVQVELQSRRQQRRIPDQAEGRSYNDTIPQLWPLDLLRLQLDEAWPSGAGLARERAITSQTASVPISDASSSTTATNTALYSYHCRRPFGGGLPRIMHGPTRWKKGYIHVDELGPLQLNYGLFSANVYLQMPVVAAAPNANRPNRNNENNGSDMVIEDEPQPQNVFDIWPTRIQSRWDWYRNGLVLSGLSSQDAESQIQLRNALGPPISIAVLPGDLLLFCAQRPHAAIGFTDIGSTRVSLQCFVQHTGIDQRLLIDC